MTALCVLFVTYSLQIEKKKKQMETRMLTTTADQQTFHIAIYFLKIKKYSKEYVCWVLI